MSKPVIIQSDNTILLEVDSPEYEAARDLISPFSELEKSPEHIHTYRITPLSLWNAAASSLKCEEIIKNLGTYSRYDIPESVITSIQNQMDRYGLLKLTMEEDSLILTSNDAILITEIFHNKKFSTYIEEKVDEYALKVKKLFRGHIKQALIKIGFPVEDLAGYDKGDPLDVNIIPPDDQGNGVELRDYQESAIKAFHKGGGPEGGSGVVVLPCGAGKTIIGIGTMDLIKSETLILVTNTIALRQWKDEIINRTNLTEDDIGEYSGDVKEVKSVTIATYNILTYRKNKKEDFLHFEIFNSKNWGLIIYDEVHLLPAPVFRMTSEIQSKRRLGLTATLIREDGLEKDVFSLIGPKKYDMPWKILEKSNWIATALCTEVRIDLPDELRMQYSVSKDREKFRISSENPRKIEFVKAILDYYSGSNILIIGQYISQLEEFRDTFKLPLITGSTPLLEREELYSSFRNGKIKCLIVSKVANFSIDLPDANVAIQISGTFGSRQEEAQRLGRILRPKKDDNMAYFYTLITSNSVEEKFAHNRQLFLTEQGYSYSILNEKMFNKKYKV